MILGPLSGVIDIECDSDDASANLERLIARDLIERAPGWKSTRGDHLLFQFDTRLSQLKNVVKLNGIEFRLGTDGQTQSVCPPSVVDGVKREWIRNLDEFPPPLLPDEVIKALLEVGIEAKVDYQTNNDPFFESLYASLRETKAMKLDAYFRKREIPFTTRKDNQRTWYEFPYCIFRGPKHKRGASAVILNPDGSIGVNCFHPECQGKGFNAIEDKYGLLNPRIQLSVDLEKTVNEAIAALAADLRVFQYGNQLVQIVSDSKPPPQCLFDNGAPKLRAIPMPTLTTYLASAARWETVDGRGKVRRTTPPDKIVKAVDANVDFQTIRRITGIVSSPMLRPDGTIVSKTGYDTDTGLFLATEGEFPSVMSADEAIACFDDILYDFPFASPAHRSAAIAMFATLQCRPAFAGATPFFMVDANASRAGKGLLTNVVTMVLEGRLAARFTPGSNEENRKVLTSVVMSGVPYLLWDNIKSKFGGEAIENLITSQRWNDRILGLSKSIDIPTQLILLGTCNNGTLTTDMLGRTLHVRLEVNEERPELRTGFKHKDLLGYIKQQRKRLAVAALSIPARYIQAGRPETKLPTWGGFEGWSDLIRNSLVWAGLADPGETREALREHADGDDTDILRQLICAWDEFAFPVTVAHAIQLVDDAQPERFPNFNAALTELGVAKEKRNDALGRLLRKYRGRVLSGRKFEKVGDKKWQVVAA